MLFIEVPAVELFNEATQEFENFKGESLMLEHSLVSLSKWESDLEKPFLGREAKTREETVTYIKHMTVSPVSSPEVYDNLSASNFQDISDYIDRKMTATVFKEIPGAPGPRTGEFITAEIMYYWMVALKIPFEAQYWHLNKLITLVKVLNLKNQPPKKMGKQSAAQQQRLLNEQRLAQMKTTG
jgi:hypothetical protein